MPHKSDYQIGHAAFYPHREFTRTYDLKYKYLSDISEDDVVRISLMNGEEIVSTWIIKTREKMIREALIKLGWTPPPEDKK